jgi:hypothetical protein
MSFFPKMKIVFFPILLLLSGCVDGPFYPWSGCNPIGPGPGPCPVPGGPCGPGPVVPPPPGPCPLNGPCRPCGPVLIGCYCSGPCTVYHPNYFYRCHNNHCVHYSPYAPNRCDPWPYYHDCKYASCGPLYSPYYF